MRRDFSLYPQDGKPVALFYRPDFAVLGNEGCRKAFGGGAGNGVRFDTDIAYTARATLYLSSQTLTNNGRINNLGTITGGTLTNNGGIFTGNPVQ